VPIADHIFATVDGIIGSFAFGGNYATEQFEGQFVQVLNESMNMLSSFSAEDFFPGALGRLVDHVTGIKARRDKIFKKLDGFFEQVVRQYEDSNRRKPAQYDDDDCASVLVQELVDLWKKPNNGGFTRDHVKAMLMVFLSAHFPMYVLVTSKHYSTSIWSSPTDSSRKKRVSEHFCGRQPH
jgi:4-hydroxyphenylacetaldehyde oxime monooxygenase